MKNRYSMGVSAVMMASAALWTGCRKEGGSSAASGSGSVSAPLPSVSAVGALASSMAAGGDVDAPPPFVPPKLTPQETAENLWKCTNDWWQERPSTEPLCQWVLTAWAGDDLDASAKKYQADCDKGDGLACALAIGGYYLAKSPLRSKALGLAEDEDAKLLIKSCELGTPLSCVSLVSKLGCIDKRYDLAYRCPSRLEGFLQRKGVDGLQAMLEPLCAKGSGASCQAIGRILQRDSFKIPKEEWMRILSYHEKACDLGDGGACGEGAPIIASLGDASLASKAQQMAEKYAAFYDQKCTRFGECGPIAHYTLEGKGVPANAAKARGYFARACSYGIEGKGYCLDLADLQAAGKGGPVNAEAARKVYEKECSVLTSGREIKSYQYGDMAYGCRGLAHLYQEGIGVPKDEKRAYEILKKACIVVDSNPEQMGRLCLDLARAEIDGRGTPVDLEQGIRRLEDPERRYLMLQDEYSKETARAAALRRAARASDAGK